MIIGTIGFIVLALGGVLLFGKFQAQPKAVVASTLTTRQIALTCTTDMATQFHIHPNVQIMVNGKQQVIPANLGIGATCMTSIHTHDTTGKIHIESPEKRDFTLGDFFAVWKQNFSSTQLLSNTTDATHSIKVTLNGKEVSTYENTVMNDGDNIVISYEPIK